MNPALKIQPEKSVVLTKAVMNAVQYYHLTGKDLSMIIGMSESTVTRLFQGKKWITPESKEGEMSLLLLRVYRSLNALVGNYHEKAIIWLNSPNHYFHQKPIDHMKTVTGLVDVVQYLDAMRGQFS